jgi:hypothetical protein
MLTEDDRLTFLKSTHDYYDELVAMFVSLASLETALTTYANRGIHPAPANPANAIHIFGRIATYSFHTFDLMHTISEGLWPASISAFRFEPNSPPILHPGSRDLYAQGLQDLIAKIVGTNFLPYFERVSNHAKPKYGGSQRTWPDVWRFAWILRNAIAHGDRFAINDPTFPTTIWRGISISGSDNGRKWFDIDGGLLAGGDVIELMEELRVTMLTP